MPPPIKDLTGLKFGRLTVIKRSGYKGRKIAWFCSCSCGKTKIITASALLFSGVKSCGCLHLKQLFKRKRSKGLGGRISTLDFE